MKKILLYLIFGIMTFAGYKIENGNIKYEGHNHRNGKFFREDKIMDKNKVDLSTFKELSTFYAADKNNVYYKGEIVEGVDSSSFQVIRMDFGKDKNYMYYGKNKLDISSAGFSFFGNESNNSIPQVRTNTLKYVKNHNSVYYLSFNSEYDKVNFLKKVEGANPKTFESWDIYIGKDDKYLYYKGEKISYIDVKTYSGAGDGYSKDKNNHYYILKKIENADYKSFKAFKTGDYSYSREYAKDKYHVFYKEKIIEGADSKTFKLLKNDFAKDKTGYYYKGERLTGISEEEIEELINSSKKRNNFLKKTE